MKEKLLTLLQSAKNPMSFESLCRKLNVSEDEEATLSLALEQLQEDYSIIKTTKESYVPIERTSFRVGKFIITSKGDCRVVVKGDNLKGNSGVTPKSRIFVVDEDKTNGAIEGDIVLVNLAKRKTSKDLIAEIQSILNRKIELVVGKVYKIGNDYYVKPADKKKKGLLVKLDSDEIEGITVSAKVNNCIDGNLYSGSVLKRFYSSCDSIDDLLLIAYQHGIDEKFSSQTLEEVRNIPIKVLDTDRIGRMDLTEDEIFTIDGADTKDIDDALSCRQLPNGNFLVGVHIADVGHYVKSGSSLDCDAYKRGTSVYFPGHVIPMLPKELSNGICSLNPGEDRLAISCFMEVTPNGNLVKYDIGKSVINSKKQMTYEEVNKVLNGEVYDDSYAPFVKTLENLNRLALAMREKRMQGGAIDFARPELKFEFADDGKVSGVKCRTSGMGENLIEEFMLLANEVVDKHLVSNGYDCLHRVHDKPVLKKVEEFFRLLNTVGLEYNQHSYFDCCDYSKYFQDLARYVENTGKLSYSLSTNLIRCMSKACYSPKNIGHFGLAKENYCHFTSPIRRYPDLITHRLVDFSLQEEDAGDILRNLDEIGLHTSKTERNAQSAENEGIKLKVAEYLEKHIGEEFDGVVVDVDELGLSVQLDNYLDGKVRIADLPGKYCYSADSFSLVSSDGWPSLTVGDFLHLKLDSVSNKTKTPNFKVLKKIDLNNNSVSQFKKKR